jgi:hypothetical protein
MRPILPPDIDLLTRAMLPLPAAARPGAVQVILDRAELADRFRKRLGRVHPEHGDGSILWLVAGSERVSHVFCDAVYCEALEAVAGAIRDWRQRRATLSRDRFRTHQQA